MPTPIRKTCKPLRRRPAGGWKFLTAGSESAVQFPVKYEMVLNLKTAKVLGLAVPPSIRLRAGEVIE
jgi:hypothetical protein